MENGENGKKIYVFVANEEGAWGNSKCAPPTAW